MTTSQPEHHEFRYLIPLEVLPRVREFVGEYLERDPHAVGHPSYSYPVNTVYLDSGLWTIFWRTVNGGTDSFDLRMRFYAENPNAPVHCQVKRRRKTLVWKDSVPMPRELAQQVVLEGQFPDERELPGLSAAQRGALQKFQELCMEFDAHPRVRTTYLREAWIDPNGSRVRLTVDHSVQSALIDGDNVFGAVHDPVKTYDKSVMMELKFVERFPNWFNELVDTFGFSPANVAKYPDSVRELDQRCSRATDSALLWG